MKHYNKTLMALFTLIMPLAAVAQDLEEITTDKELSAQLLPLNYLIELGIDNSSAIDHFTALINKSEHEIVVVRRMWQNNIFGFANYSTGDQRILTGSTNLPGDVLTSSVATGYRAGVQVNIPIFEFTGRKPRIKIQEEEMKAVSHKRDEVELDIRRQIISEYFEMLGMFEIFKTRSEGREAMRSSYMVAEKEFKEGIIDIGELSQLRNSVSQAEVYYQGAKYEFYARISGFAALIGVEVSDLFLEDNITQ